MKAKAQLFAVGVLILDSQVTHYVLFAKFVLEIVFVSTTVEIGEDDVEKTVFNRMHDVALFIIIYYSLFDDFKLIILAVIILAPVLSVLFIII